VTGDQPAQDSRCRCRQDLRHTRTVPTLDEVVVVVAMAWVGMESEATWRERLSVCDALRILCLRCTMVVCTCAT